MMFRINNLSRNNLTEPMLMRPNRASCVRRLARASGNRRENDANGFWDQLAVFVPFLTTNVSNPAGICDYRGHRPSPDVTQFCPAEARSIIMDIDLLGLFVFAPGAHPPCTYHPDPQR
ncbi:hypothetical protein RA28_07755 [Ruegeria sp. ANG-S4]|nr:hypothetical protein RA28_07755 [Ruegeria sp. ANG-S4]